VSAFQPAKFLHVGFTWKGTPKAKELEPVFAQALDWLRYAPNCWIVWTTTDAQGWYERLAPHMTTNDRLLVCELNLANTKQGWQEKWLWDWLNKPRSYIDQSNR
jgi:hypothetical protein